jgi:hypothetical protein
MTAATRIVTEARSDVMTEAARLTAALVDQAGTTVKPRQQEILDIDDTFCAAHGSQQLAF